VVLGVDAAGLIDQQATGLRGIWRVPDVADGVLHHGGVRAIADLDAVLGDVVDPTLARHDVLLDRRGGFGSGERGAIGRLAADGDPVLLGGVDAVAADRAAGPVDIEDRVAVLRAVKRTLPD